MIGYGINKALKAASIIRPGVTAYGVRHAFKERLRAADIDQRTAEEIMGHLINSESLIYGRRAPVEITAPFLVLQVLERQCDWFCLTVKLSF